MRFTPTSLGGAYLIDLQRLEDERGFFARAWCRREFERHGLTADFVQANVGFSHRRGTVRGMHYQRPPHAEAKLVRCTAGAVWDVIIDLRPESPTYRQWVGAELTAANRRMLYAPPGFAHGYQTLVDDSELVYETSQFYAPEAATGVRYDDPIFAIAWPLEVSVISAADSRWPDCSGEAAAVGSAAPGKE
jgi:dTDP-4-dehydrorhamnose 3,5-epimerase